MFGAAAKQQPEKVCDDCRGPCLPFEIRCKACYVALVNKHGNQTCGDNLMGQFAREGSSQELAHNCSNCHHTDFITLLNPPFLRVSDLREEIEKLRAVLKERDAELLGIYRRLYAAGL